MVVEFKLPELSDGVSEVDVADIMIAVGDTVERDQEVIEAEADKGVMGVPIDVAGTVKEIKVSKGQTVKVGQVLMTIDEAADDGKADAKKDDKKTDKADKAQKQDAKQQESQDQDPEKDEPKKQDSTPAEQPKAESQPQEKKAAASKPPASSGDGRPVAAAPSVRQFARELGIDIQSVPGSGPGGRISEEDVKSFARGVLSGAIATGGGTAGPREKREPMSKVRKLTSAHMAKVWNTVPHVTLHDEADVTEMEAVRQQYKRAAEAAGAKLTVTAIFVRIAALALRAFPNVNASIDSDAQEIVLHNYCNIGVAVDTPRGLVVPVLRDADQKSIFEIGKELTEISGKARSGKLTPDDMSGGTLTITNLGSIGTGYFTPIVNHPEVAILGMGRAKQQPVWDGKAFAPRLMAPLSLSFDHRLVDGADGARFLQWIIAAAQNPLSMLMNA